MCEPATRGIWADAICRMYEDKETYFISGTERQLQSLLRCPNLETFRLAVADLQQTQAAQVTIENGIITFVSRRLLREWQARESARERQAACRKRKNENAGVTDLSQPAVYTDNGIKEYNLLSENEGAGMPPSPDELFKRFWLIYPRKESLQKARAAFIKARIDENLLVDILEWLGRAIESEQWQNPSMVPHAATLLNQRRWEGAPPPPPLKGVTNGANRGNMRESTKRIEFDPDQLPGYQQGNG